MLMHRIRLNPQTNPGGVALIDGGTLPRPQAMVNNRSSNPPTCRKHHLKYKKWNFFMVMVEVEKNPRF